MEFGWQIVLGSIVGFFGAAFGRVGGVGGGGIYVPMLTLIIGFDPKSSTAISKCTLSKAFLKGVETWKKETLVKNEASKRAELNGGGGQVEYKPLPSGPANGNQEMKAVGEPEVSILENVRWKELGLLVLVWFAFLGLQVAKNDTSTCSTSYWVLNLLQIPISVGVALYQGFSLYTGRRVIASKGDEGTSWKIPQLFFYCFCGVLAGVVGGLLGLGGGFILGPLFLELGIPPQVSSAMATFAMTFSSSMSVVEYYLLRRFPIPYGFCGETEEDHADTLSLIRAVGYDMAYMFAYSTREKTHAHRNYVDDVPDGDKQRRLTELIDAFRETTGQHYDAQVGTIQLVLVKSSRDGADGRE